METARKFSDIEEAILRKLLEPAFPGKDQIKKQLAHSMAVPTNDTDNYGSTYLKVSKSPSAIITERIPVEGVLHDTDGVPINILLHVVNGFVNELEVFKADGSPIMGHINPEKMSVSVNKSKR